ncbi:PHD finger protein At1g33420-like [Triticum dicoccoides]|uniref:PHD finger protein At1g33420-like n=1 Tax=Triticum dicoccoides TaxID=85692 RepID=UPI00188DC6B3|nr:PHD finger protein At1g33420-like [Triticum dicoccoides]
MAVLGRPTKRARRGRVLAEPCLLDLRAFPGRKERAAAASFRANVRGFLSRHASPAPPPAEWEQGGVLGDAGAVWQVGFRVGEEGEASVVVMDVVEEDVPRARRVHCDHCTVAGWSRHPVCVKKYHFIIRNEKMASCKTCRRCGLMVQIFETRCPACSHGSALPHDESEDWDYAQIDDPRHLLHGIVHENGFGHLVRINGHEGGSSLLTGYQLMDFWDRLCTYLRVRKVSVLDVSKKFEVDYRVLHAIATGCSWYGQWGFKLGSGSFGITSETYSKAIENLSSVSLSHFFPHSRYPRNQLQDTIAFYQSLSKRPLTTFRDLFLYVLGLAAGKSVHTHLVTMHKRELAYDANFKEENWADEKIKQAMDVALKVLRAADRWVAMRTLKAATAHPIGSPQLVDYCLKTIGGTRTYDGMVVVVRCNSETNTIEYRLTDEILPPKNASMPTRDHLFRDIKFLYDALLNPHTMPPYKPEHIHEHANRSAMVLLDCKQFIKHYDMEEDFLPQNQSVLHIWCQVELLDQVGDPPSLPAELLTLTQTATVADLKMEAVRTFQSIYLMLQSFVANQLLDCPTADDTTQVKLLFGAKGTVSIQGKCVGGERRVAIYRMERGVDQWTVNCSCGAKDDDGERMLSCDSCHVWQHTRCVGISDFVQVPKRFVCASCKLLHKSKMYSSFPNKRCKTGSFSHASSGLWRPNIS